MHAYNELFPHLNNTIYLNHAAVAPWPTPTSAAVITFAQENNLYGAKNYLQWLKVQQRLRKNLAQLINAPAQADIALVKNTSEALSIVAYGLDWQAGDNIVTSNEEFPSNRIVWQSLDQYGVELRQADLKADESPEQSLISQIDERTKLLTISSVEYASGTRLDLNMLGKYCCDRGIYFCVDAIQSLGAFNFDVQQCQADFVMADGHKWLLGPEGLGLFYCRAEVRKKLHLKQYGWHMVDPLGDYDNPDWQVAKSARRFECGSPNMIGIYAFDASIALILDIGITAIETQILDNTQYLSDKINQHQALNLLSNPSKKRRSGIVTFSLKNGDNNALYQHLMDNNVICAPRGGGVRFSPHFYTPKEQLDKALKIVDRFVDTMN